MADLLSDFAAAVARTPDRTAIIDGLGRRVSFAQLQARAQGLARAWHACGIGKGDRVLLAMRVDADLYASLAALWSLGATVVLPEPAMGLAGLRHAVRVAGVTAFASAGAYGLLRFALPALWRLPHVRPIAKPGLALELPLPDAGDLALISFTSGTSGAPKAIPRSHGFLAAQHRAIAPMLDSSAAEVDLVAFPVFVLINIASGRTSVLPNWKMSQLAQVQPAALTAWMAQHTVTRALLPPALCDTLAGGAIPPSLHTVFTGGGPIFPDLLRRLQAEGPALDITCVYGSTEAEPIAHLSSAQITAQDVAAMAAGQGLLVGPPVRDIQVRIVAGEIQVAGGHVNGGYLDPAHDAENKVRIGQIIWHRTGDAGYFDAQRRLWLLGRVGTQVDLAGKPTYPFQIEVAARSWPGAAQCALMSVRGAPCLVIAGDAACLNAWTKAAAQLDISSVKHIARIPMDRRHASKVDRKALQKLL
ncbi:MAG: AMP-binding protein [Alphaproteobacteria bacterium]|nr:AMP-binding protein [Alphaproteobacteria bacterium]